MTMLLSQKHYLVGGRLIEEFYAGEFHDAACIRKTSLVRCRGCNGEREEGSKEVRQALTVLIGDGTWAGEVGSRVNLLPASPLARGSLRRSFPCRCPSPRSSSLSSLCVMSLCPNVLSL